MEDSVFASIGVVAISLLYVIWSFVRRYLENRKPFKELAMPPGSHWLLGHAPTQQRAKDFPHNFKYLTQDYENEFGQTGYWLAKVPVVSVTDWRDARKVMNAEHYHVAPFIIKRHMDMFIGENNILVMNGKEWKIHRSPIVRALKPSVLMGSRADIKEVVENAVSALKKRLEVESVTEVVVQDIMKLITLDVFGKAAFSTDIGCCKDLTKPPVAHGFDFLVQDHMRRLQSPVRPDNWFYSIPNKENRKHKMHRATIRDYLAKLIQTRRASSKNYDEDMLSRLMQVQEEGKEIENGEVVSEQTLTDVLMVLLFAGYDTTSISLSYALYLVSQNPDVEKRCLEEVARASQLDNPDELVYCKGVILEALRLYTPVHHSIRTMQKPIQLQGGFTVPKDTFIFVPIWLIHRDERVFPQPNEFRPDRWVKREKDGGPWEERMVDEEFDNSGSTTIAAANRNALLTFSAGARSCPGEKFAIQEATLVLANLIKELKFRPTPGYKLVPQRSSLLQRPAGGLPMQVELRK